jgi:integrase
MATRAPDPVIKFDPRTGFYNVRFRFAGQRYHRTTGKRDSGEAKAEATRIVEEVKRRGRVAAARGKSPAMEDLFGAWIEDVKAERAAPTAKEMERYAGGTFLDAFPTLGSVNDASLAAYSRDRLRAVSASTVNKELSALRVFLRWCVGEGVLLEAPVVPKLDRRSLGTPNTERVQMRVDLTERQALALVAELPEEMRRSRVDGSTHPLRDIYRLLWETGLRIGTIDRLESPRHWRHGSRELNITADIDKARYARVVPVSEAARKILDRHAKGVTGLIFGRRTHQGSMLAAALRIKLPEDQARRVGPHDFRHAAITHLANSGAPLASVAYLVGHKNLTMTARYVHANKDNAAAALTMGGRKTGHRSGTRAKKMAKVKATNKRGKRL